MYYNRFRYYDCESGVYISRDPIGLAGGMPNIYAYVHDPNTWVDVLGLECLKKTKKTSFEAKTRREALREAKRDAGIPKSQHPVEVNKVDIDDGFGNKIFDKNGKPIQAREYVYTNSKGDNIVLQEHSLGHPKSDAGSPASRAHFNVRPSNNTRTGNVPSIHGHYNF